MLVEAIILLSLPKNVWVIAVTFSLSMSGIALLLFVGGIVGTELSSSDKLSTLPIAAFVIGNAISTIPAALISQRLNRKGATYVGFSLSLISAPICAFAIEHDQFLLFGFGSFLIGVGTAFYNQLRFAAIESLSDAKNSGPALSLIMLFSVVGSLFGPEMVGLAQWLPLNIGAFSGAFLIFGFVIVLSMLIFTLFKTPPHDENETMDDARPVKQFALQTGFIIALSGAAIGYALMSFLMTSTPISMHIIDGHSLSAAKGVIQAHLIAMFLPSVFSGLLIKKYGANPIMLLGAVTYLCVIVIALSGQHVIHYTWALILLGVGWNFLFIGGTSLLPQYYRKSERFKAQAINDFCVFSLQAIASLSAAWVLFEYGWASQLWLCIPPTLLLVFACSYLLYSNRLEGKSIHSNG